MKKNEAMTSEQCLQASQDLLAAAALNRDVEASAALVARAQVYASMGQAQATREQTVIVNAAVRGAIAVIHDQPSSPEEGIALFLAASDLASLVGGPDAR